MRAFAASWRLVLAVALIALQAAVLAVGLFAPDVSPGYRAFFIDHSTTELPSPATAPETSPAPVAIGTAGTSPT